VTGVPPNCLNTKATTFCLTGGVLIDKNGGAGREQLTFSIAVPTPDGGVEIRIEPGASAVIVGANGSGKTRLAVFIENELKLGAHRISAHRALSLNTAVPKISERMALLGLRTGFVNEKAQFAHRKIQRWQQQEAVSLLNDFDYLVQALFADQTNKSLKTHQTIRSGGAGPAERTRLEQLAEVWERLLPHQELRLTGDNVRVSGRGSEAEYGRPIRAPPWYASRAVLVRLLRRAVAFLRSNPQEIDDLPSVGCCALMRHVSAHLQIPLSGGERKAQAKGTSR
jgi:hypothetical protein